MLRPDPIIYTAFIEEFCLKDKGVHFPQNKIAGNRKEPYGPYRNIAARLFREVVFTLNTQ